MIKILDLEFYRLKKSKLYWAMLITCAVLPLIATVMVLLLMWLVYIVFGEGETTAEMLWQALHETGLTGTSLTGAAGLSSNVALLSMVCSSIFISREFTGGTVRNILLSNKSRNQLYLSTLTVALFIGASCLCANFASILLFQATVFGFGGLAAGRAATSVIASFGLGLIAVAVGQCCVCLFAFATRKTGATIACPLLICIFAPSIVATIVSLITLGKIMMGGTLSDQALSWIPLYNNSLYDASAVDGALVGKIILYNLPIGALFGVLGWNCIRRADLK